ncbi:MAG: LacI family transcriptional regulator [Opitutaceae bacterium]|nr:LacI family transcriptional regulator [Opitutaceae bacterium]
MNKKSSHQVVTVADLARHLGLSAWTVSRAINGHPEVREPTKQRIREAMAQLGFRPNLFARGLRGHGSGLVGVCFAGLHSPILNTKLYHLQEFLRRHQLRGLLEISLRDPQNELRVIEDFLGFRVDGIVLIHSTLPAKDASRLLAKIPSVSVDPHEPHTITTVSLDRQMAMELLLNHLLNLGHRSIALLGIGRTDAWRWPALDSLARRRGLDPERLFAIVGNAQMAERGIEAGRGMAATVLGMTPRPTALLCLDDRVAVGAAQFIKMAGMLIPRDFSITGFDNLDLARQLQPTITTIEQNPSALMETAGELLLAQISPARGRRPRAASRMIAPALLTGESTGPAPGPAGG